MDCLFGQLASSTLFNKRRWYGVHGHASCRAREPLARSVGERIGYDCCYLDDGITPETKPHTRPLSNPHPTKKKKSVYSVKLLLFCCRIAPRGGGGGEGRGGGGRGKGGKALCTREAGWCISSHQWRMAAEVARGRITMCQLSGTPHFWRLSGSSASTLNRRKI